jgi:hypothetical protein
MRGLLYCPVSLFAAALITGCDDRRPPTAVVTGGAQSDFAENPSSPSPIIVRVDGLPVRVISTDAARGLLAIHGPVSNLPVCTDASTRDPVDIQVIRTPSDVEGIVLLIRAADTHVTIYAGVDISALFPFAAARFCPFVQNTPKLYEGIVQYTVNLGSSSTSFRWEGRVTRVSDGAAFHYVEDQHTVFQQGTDNTATTASAIRLEAIP